MASPGAGVAGIVVLIMAMAMGGKKAKPKPKPAGPKCPPFEYNEAAIELSIAAAVAAGMRGRLTVATMVAQATWTTHPETKFKIMWPPPMIGAPEDIMCLWTLLLGQIDAYFERNHIPPWPDCPPGTKLNEAAQRCEEDVPPPPPKPDDLPPFDPTDYETPLDADYPTPGTLLQIRYGDRLGGKFSKTNNGNDEDGKILRSILYTTLLTAGWLAAKAKGASDEDGAQFARDVAYTTQNRRDYQELILCSPWNDALYTTHGYGPKAGTPSPLGRALRLLPQDYDNRKRLITGKAPRRNMRLGTPADQGKGNAYGANQSERNFAYIWLPKINLDILWTSGGTVVTTEDVEWSDGSNGIMPPPIVVAYGVENVPESASWGCLGYEASSIGD